MKNWGAFVLQKARKDGHLQVPRLQFLRRDQRGLHMRRTVVDSQPWDSQMTIFSCLLQHKGAPIFHYDWSHLCRGQSFLLHSAVEGCRNMVERVRPSLQTGCYRTTSPEEPSRWLLSLYVERKKKKKIKPPLFWKKRQISASLFSTIRRCTNFFATKIAGEVCAIWKVWRAKKGRKAVGPGGGAI